MARVEIIGPKGLFFDVVSLVHNQGRLHIEDLSKKIQQGELPLDRMEVVDRQEHEREQMDEMLIRVRSILKALDRSGGGEVDPARVKSEYDRLFDLDADKLEERVRAVIEEVEDRTATLAATHTDLESEVSLLTRYEPILHKIQPLARQIVTTGSYDSVALLFERRYKQAIDALKEELDRITNRQYELISTDVDEDTTAAIVVFSRQYSEAVHKFLAMENVNQIRLPSEFDGMPFDAAYDELKRRRRELPEDLTRIRAELDQMSARWRERLLAIRDVLVDRTAEIEAIPQFGRTEYAFVITGWMPVEDIGGLRKEISARWKDDVIVEQLEIREEEFGDTPVALKNPKALKPFETLLGAYGMPRYGTMDATWMIFVFYPLFFGMIVGDIGYGLIMLGIVLWLRFKFKENDGIKLATSILGPAATMVVAFGFVYGEFFGNLLGERYLNLIQRVNLGPLTLPFDRVHFIETFMVLAVAVGVVQILLGLAFGIVNALRTKNKHHLYEKGGLLVLLVSTGIAVALGVLTSEFGTWSTLGQVAFAALAFAGFVFAIRGGGMMGAIESVLSVTHMASYIRIMAVGLGGAIFADAVNEIVAGVGNVVLGLIIGILLHGLNFIIAAFSPTIHALRLNFLEFFGTFYETGKQQYKPFTKTGGEKGA